MKIRSLKVFATSMIILLLFGCTPPKDLLCQEIGNLDEYKLFKLGFSSGPATVTKSRVFIGTSVYGSTTDQDAGLLLCLSRDGKLLWKATHKRLPKRINDIPGMGIKSTPLVDDDRVYYYSNRGEIVCLDVEGFHDSSNEGPVVEEEYTSLESIDVVWKTDLVSQFRVFKRDASDVGNPLPSVIQRGNVIYCMTGHGGRFRLTNNLMEVQNNPDVPSLVALHKTSGRVIWSNNSSSKNTFYGQWGTPTIVPLPNAAAGIVYPGGDGGLHMADIENGKPIWSTDLNDESVTLIQRGFCSGKPLVCNDLLIVGLGVDYESIGQDCSTVVAVDKYNGRKRWRYRSKRNDSCLGNIVSNSAKEVVFALLTSGFVIALDAKTGKEMNVKDLGESAAVFSSASIQSEMLYVPSSTGLHVYTADIQMDKISEIQFDSVVQASPTIFEDTLFLPTSTHLFAIPTNKLKGRLSE